MIPFRMWYEFGERNDNAELMAYEISLAETLAYRDDALRDIRKHRAATVPGFKFFENSVQVV